MRLPLFSRVSAAQLAVWLLVLLTGALIGFRVLQRDLALSDLLPETSYRVSYVMSLDGRVEGTNVRTFLPADSERQTVASEVNIAPASLFRVSEEGSNRLGSWTQPASSERLSLRYDVDVTLRPLSVELPAGLERPDSYPKAIARFLQPETAIQVDDPEIIGALGAIGADQGDTRARLERIFAFTKGLRSRAFKGTTDALTALRLEEASCNGKSRLFVALARAAGLPARLVGGLVLEPGTKRTGHQWTEVYVSGVWVPFDPTNDHFAGLPANYLTLYRGDEALFTHTSDVKFDYEFSIEEKQLPARSVLIAESPLNLWALFERVGLPLSLLQTLLLLPIGAFVVVVARNVVGVPTFGTFLPALIATAMLHTGVLWGTWGLLGILFVVASVRMFVQRLELLHSPTQAILLAFVSASMLGASFIGERFGVRELTRLSLFPLAVVAITAERFYVALEDSGPRRALSELSGTLVVIYACYALMQSIALQSLVTVLPETLLVFVAAEIYLGTWTGLRLSEHLRFRPLLRTGSAT